MLAVRGAFCDWLVPIGLYFYGALRMTLGSISALNCDVFCVDLHFAWFFSLAAFQGCIV